MALGTITAVTQSGQAPMNAQFKDVVTLVLDTYATGGFTAAAIQTKLRSLTGRAGRTIVSVKVLDAAGYVGGWDAANSKLKFYRIPALDGNAASAQPLEEVGDGVNLSGVTASLEIESV
jgi:hypothetical protein